MHACMHVDMHVHVHVHVHVHMCGWRRGSGQSASIYMTYCTSKSEWNIASYFRSTVIFSRAEGECKTAYE